MRKAVSGPMPLTWKAMSAFLPWLRTRSAVRLACVSCSSSSGVSCFPSSLRLSMLMICFGSWNGCKSASSPELHFGQSGLSGSSRRRCCSVWFPQFRQRRLGRLA